MGDITLYVLIPFLVMMIVIMALALFISLYVAAEHIWSQLMQKRKQTNITEELPGMWEESDLSGGKSDTEQ